MPSYHLPIHIKNATLELLDEIAECKGSLHELSAAARVTEWYRVRGLAQLLLSGTADECIADLRRSSYAFLQFLTTADDASKVTGKSDPFFDALAAHDWEAATRIAQESRSEFNVGLEFEDDFLYVHFLMQHFFLNATVEEQQEILSRYRAILDGEDDPKCDICEAILEKDQESFEQGLQDLLETFAAVQQRRIDNGLLTDEQSLTSARVSIEGLALIRLWESKYGQIVDVYESIPTALRHAVRSSRESPDWTQP